MELIQITATYSNAVLMMVLANASDVAAKLDLPILKPVEAAHVQKFVCDPRKDAIGGWLTLTNGFNFWFSNGYMDGMESAHSYFALQDPDRIPRFFGTVRMSEAEMVQMARQAVRGLGYNPTWLKNKPIIEAPGTPVQDKPKVIPHFRLKWADADAPGLDGQIEIEINADAKRIEKFWLGGRAFWRQQPKLAQPAPIPQSPASVHAGGVRLTPLTIDENARVLNEICAKASELAQKLSLPTKRPISPKDVKQADTGFSDGKVFGQIIMEGGWRFNFAHGNISSFHAPDSEAHVDAHQVWFSVPAVDSRKFFGKVAYSKKQIEEFARAEVRKLGLPDADVFLDQKPLVSGGPSERDPNYARFHVRWDAPSTKRRSDPNAQFIRAEVDGLSLELKSLLLRTTNLQRPDANKQ